MKPSAMLTRVKERLFSSLFWQSFMLIREKPQPFFVMVFFEFLFFLLVAGGAILIKMVFTSRGTFSVTALGNHPLLPPLLALVGLFSYYMILIAIFTFFQYCVLDAMLDYFEQQPFSFLRFTTLFWLHVFTFGVFSLTLFLFNSLLASLKPSYQAVGTILLLVPVFIFAYAYLTILQVFFLREQSLKKVFKGSISFFREGIGYYGKIILFSILISLLYILVLFILVSSAFFALGMTKIGYSSLIRLEETVTMIFMALFFLFVLSFNRILFYQTITVHYKPKH